MFKDAQTGKDRFNFDAKVADNVSFKTSMQFAYGELLPREMEIKIADLEHKYRVQVTLTGCAAMRILVPVAQIMVLLRYRKLQRDLRVIWNPITRRLDPWACEDCQKTMRILTPRDRGSNLFLLCPFCAAKR